MALDLSTGWGKVINDLYRQLYARDVTEAELWPIAEKMAAKYMSTDDIRAAIIAQSGPPLTQGWGRR